MAGRGLETERQRIVLGLAAYAAGGGLLLAALRWIDVRHLLLDLSSSAYGGVIAVLFAGLGVWGGRQLTARQRSAGSVATRNTAAQAAVPSNVAHPLGVAALTERELEILGEIAAGWSNREIATRLFVSENTVKTHAKRLFEKLEVSRRTQAVARATELGLLSMASVERSLEADSGTPNDRNHPFE